MKALTQDRIDRLENAFGLQPGESYTEETCYTRNRVTRYKGHKIESFYDENACMFRAWVKGIGPVASWFDEERTLEQAKEKIDRITT